MGHLPGAERYGDAIPQLSHIKDLLSPPPAGNIEKARGILKGIDSVLPGLVLVRLRQIGLEVRDHKYEAAEVLYQQSVANAESTEARNFYSWRYARFAAKVRPSDGPP